MELGDGTGSRSEGVTRFLVYVPFLPSYRPPMEVLAFTAAFTGLLIAAIGAPMWLGKIPPNPWYGFRTERTTANEQIWYAANTRMGRGLTVGGLVGALAAALTVLVVPDPNGAVLGSLGAMLVPMIGGIVHGFGRTGHER